VTLTTNDANRQSVKPAACQRHVPAGEGLVRDLLTRVLALPPYPV